MLMGFDVDLKNDLISLPYPKILGELNLINAPEFNPGCQTIGLRSAQELRGRITIGRTRPIYGAG